MTRTPRVVVVGAGVTGLSAAWHLRREAQRRGAALDVVVLERDGRPGGKVRSERVAHPLGDFVVEAGADSFLTQSKPWATELTMELGIGERLIGTNDDARKVFVLNRGRLYPLPEGIFLIVPTRLGPFVRSGLLSPAGKLRTGLDLVLPRRKDDGDETLAEFVDRRLGSQILDRIAEPLLSGIYNADAGRQSVLATLPRLRQLEKDHRSLILAALALRKKTAAARSTAPGGRRGATGGDGRGPGGDSAAAAGPPRSMFVSFRGGMQELVDTLAGQLRDELKLGTAVERIEGQTGGGYRVTVSAAAGGAAAGPSSSFVAEAVVLCTPAVESARLLGDLAPQGARLLATIRSVSTGTVSLAYEGDVLPPAARGFGLVIPTSERRPVNAVTCSSVKFDGRAPDGCTLLRVFFGGSRSPQTFGLPDDEVVDVARRQVADLLDVGGTPLFSRLDRWPEAQPQYDVGHLDLVAAIESALPPAIWVTGAACRGVGIPDCVRQGRDTATDVAAALL